MVLHYEPGKPPETKYACLSICIFHTYTSLPLTHYSFRSQEYRACGRRHLIGQMVPGTGEDKGRFLMPQTIKRRQPLPHYNVCLAPSSADQDIEECEKRCRQYSRLRDTFLEVEGGTARELRGDTAQGSNPVLEQLVPRSHQPLGSPDWALDTSGSAGSIEEEVNELLADDESSGDTKMMSDNARSESIWQCKLSRVLIVDQTERRH